MSAKNIEIESDPYLQKRGWREYSAAAFKMLSLRGKERVLEVGCGSGWFASDLIRHNDCLLTVLDPLVNAVTECRFRCAGFHRDRGLLSYVVGMGEELPFKAASYDILVFWASYHHLHDQHSALSEASRVLKIDGRLLFFDFVLSNDCKNEWFRIEKMKDASTYGVYSYSDILASLNRSGFTLRDTRLFLHTWDVDRWMSSVDSDEQRRNVRLKIENVSEKLNRELRIKKGDASFTFITKYRLLLATRC